MSPDAAAEHCRFCYWTRLSHGDGSKTEKSHVGFGALKCKYRIRANGFERFAISDCPHGAPKLVDAVVRGSRQPLRSMDEP